MANVLSLEDRALARIDAATADTEAWPGTDGDITDLLATTPPPVPFFARDRLLANRAHILTGQGGSSKTRVLIHLAIAAVIGRLPWGWEIERTGSAALFLTEDTRADIHRKLHDYALGLSPAERQMLASKLKVFPLAAVGQNTLLELEPGGGLRETLRTEALLRTCKAIPDLRFIGLDPALSLTEGDELNQAHQRRLGKLADRMAIEADACVVIVTHASKALNGADEVGSHASRGGGALTDAVRGEYVLRTMTAAEARQYGIDDLEERKRLVQLVCTKANDLPPAAFVPTWLRRGHGGLLSAADLAPIEPGMARLTPRDLEALAIIKAMAARATPNIGDLRAEMARRGLIKGSDEAMKKTAQRTVNNLLTHGLIEKGIGRGSLIPVVGVET